MRGEVTIRVRCLMPEKLIDRATAQGARFDEVHLVGENAFVVCCDAASARRLLALCRRFGLDAAITARRGGSALRRFAERRGTLAAGIAVAVVLCALFLTRLWVVDIAFTGEQAFLGDTASLSQSLEAMGIRPGISRRIDAGLIAQQLLAEDHRYSYVGAKLQGGCWWRPFRRPRPRPCMTWTHPGIWSARWTALSSARWCAPARSA